MAESVRSDKWKLLLACILIDLIGVSDVSEPGFFGRLVWRSGEISWKRSSHDSHGPRLGVGRLKVQEIVVVVVVVVVMVVVVGTALLLLLFLCPLKYS